ncbi:MAG: glycosyltransferase family 39 protein, partial [Candidatus Latescibacterota bacterium]|nr:glycosyltransferase family 39 protein [Candidatus Latescibacterota bacterium]
MFLLRHTHAILLVAAVILACVLRLLTLGSSLGHDEAYTLEAFASQPYERIVTSYAAPNNHILHSLMVRCSVQLLGTESWAVRLPAFAAGILAVPLIFVLARNLFLSASAGLIAAWMLAMMPVHILYSQAARGYSLSILLAILALYAIHRAVTEGSFRQWISFGLWGFLGAWTLPSGAFHVVSLGIWGVLKAGPDGRRRALSATLATLAAIVLAYLPISDALTKAGERWGVDVGLSDPLALPRVFTDAAAIWIRGWESLLPTVAALTGLALASRRNRDLTRYLALAWSVPMVAAVVLGVAGQPRSYLYLLPTFVLAAAYGLTQVPRVRHRVVIVAVLLGGYGWSAVTSAEISKQDPYGELADYMAAAPEGDLFVTPFIMDVRVWTNAKETIGRNLVAALGGHHVDRLHVLTSSSDARFELEDCLLKSNAGPVSVAFTPGSFTEVYRSGSLVLNRLRSRGVNVFSQEQTSWLQFAAGDGQRVRQRAGAPAVSSSASLSLENPARQPFQLYSSSRFSVSGEGALVLAFARTVKDSYLSIYGIQDGAKIDRPHMLKTAAWPTPVRSSDDQLWLLEAYLLPVQPQTEYGIYVLGSD